MTWKKYKLTKEEIGTILNSYWKYSPEDLPDVRKLVKDYDHGLADAATKKAVEGAREDWLDSVNKAFVSGKEAAFKEVVQMADDIANTSLVGNSRLNLYQQLFERLRYEYERKAATSGHLPASVTGKEEKR